MTRQQLSNVLDASSMFSTKEIEKILQMVGKFTLGNAIIACELLDIELSGNDIDILISVAQKRQAPKSEPSLLQEGRKVRQ